MCYLLGYNATQSVETQQIFQRNASPPSWEWVVVLCYKSKGHRFESWWGQWIFQFIHSFLEHYGPQLDSASSRNEFQEYPKGVKLGWCIRLATPLPSVGQLSKKCGILDISEPHWHPRTAYCELLHYMPVYYQDPCYEASCGISVMRNAAERYCSNVHINNIPSTLLHFQTLHFTTLLIIFSWLSR
jgi:hypothetical protein